jgi:hypothetical protein
MKEIVKNLEAKDFRMQNKLNELEFKDVQMRDKVTNLEAKVAQQDLILSDLLREKNERTAANHFEFFSNKQLSISFVRKRTAILMQLSQTDWAHPEWILFYRRIGHDRICFLRFL